MVGFPNNHGKILLKRIILGCEMGVPPFKETPTSSNGCYLLFWGCSSFLGFGESSHQSMEFFFFSQSVVTKVLGHNWTVQPSNGWESLFGKEEG